MSPLEAIAIGLAGLAAGTINTVVGSGTLITFPTLLAFGVPPVTANVSNTIGLVPGSVSGVVGYRRELEGQRARVAPDRRRLARRRRSSGRCCCWCCPRTAFSAIVPALVGLGILLVVFQPRISRWVAARHDAPGAAPRNPVLGAWWVWPGGAGGRRVRRLLRRRAGRAADGDPGRRHPGDLQRLNALKNVLAAIVNAVAGLLFVVVADVDWQIVALIGVGSVIGGQLGATVGRRLPGPVLRWTIVVVGVVALAVFLLG